MRTQKQRYKKGRSKRNVLLHLNIAFMHYYDTAVKTPETLYPFRDLRKAVRVTLSDSYRYYCQIVFAGAAGYKPVRQLGERWQLYLRREYANTVPLPYQLVRVLNRPERLLYHRPTI